jgi:hypothetical protein
VPLSDDQRALLRLLAQREEGYEDIAALMGLSVAEVRSRVKGALTELDEGGQAAGPAVGRGTSSSQAAGEEPSPTPPAAEASETKQAQTPPAEAPAAEQPSDPKAEGGASADAAQEPPEEQS